MPFVCVSDSHLARSRARHVFFVFVVKSVCAPFLFIFSLAKDISLMIKKTERGLILF